MNFKEYINEIEITSDPTSSTEFDKALKLVFSPGYYKKVNNVLKKQIKIIPVKEREGVVAFSKKGNIYVNKLEFEKRSDKEKMKYLLHEFIHIIQTNGILLKKFKEINKLTNQLRKILKQSLKTDISVFLTGKKANLGAGGKHEILSYLMNDSINWDAITPEGKEKFIGALKQSGIFNLSTGFWKKRLS